MTQRIFTILGGIGLVVMGAISIWLMWLNIAEDATDLIFTHGAFSFDLLALGILCLLSGFGLYRWDAPSVLSGLWLCISLLLLGLSVDHKLPGSGAETLAHLAVLLLVVLAAAVVLVDRPRMRLGRTLAATGGGVLLGLLLIWVWQLALFEHAQKELSAAWEGELRATRISEDLRIDSVQPAELNQLLAELDRQIADADAQLPNELDLQEFDSQLRELATEHGVDVEDLQAGPRDDRKLHVAVPASVVLVGTKNRLLALLADLDRIKRLTHWRSASVIGRAQTEGQFRVSLDFSLFAYRGEPRPSRSQLNDCELPHSGVWLPPYAGAIKDLRTQILARCRTKQQHPALARGILTYNLGRERLGDKREIINRLIDERKSVSPNNLVWPE